MTAMALVTALVSSAALGRVNCATAGRKRGTATSMTLAAASLAGLFVEAQVRLAAAQACAAGKYLSSAICTDCAAGKFSAAEGATVASTCENCLAGTYSAAGASVCTNCAAGKFFGSSGQTNDVCTSCVAGTYSAAGASVCTNCAAGKFFGSSGQTSDVCTSCVAGTYSGSPAQTSIVACTGCGAGKYSAAGASVCTDCVAGKYKTAAGVNTACDDCAADTYMASTGASACTNCPTGKYQNVVGQVNCKITPGNPACVRIQNNTVGWNEISGCNYGTYDSSQTVSVNGVTCAKTLWISDSSVQCKI